MGNVSDTVGAALNKIEQRLWGLPKQTMADIVRSTRWVLNYYTDFFTESDKKTIELGVDVLNRIVAEIDVAQQLSYTDEITEYSISTFGISESKAAFIKQFNLLITGLSRIGARFDFTSPDIVSVPVNDVMVIGSVSGIPFVVEKTYGYRTGTWKSNLWILTKDKQEFDNYMRTMATNDVFMCCTELSSMFVASHDANYRTAISRQLLSLKQPSCNI